METKEAAGEKEESRPAFLMLIGGVTKVERPRREELAVSWHGHGDGHAGRCDGTSSSKQTHIVGRGRKERMKGFGIDIPKIVQEAHTLVPAVLRQWRQKLQKIWQHVRTTCRTLYYELPVTLSIHSGTLENEPKELLPFLKSRGLLGVMTSLTHDHGVGCYVQNIGITI